jgi:succinate-acetate transporter protein
MEGVMGAQAMSQDASVNPGIFPLLLFGYSLAVLGVELLITPEAAGALAFAIFVAAVGETIGGLWEISQGETYIGSIITTFGIWLLGLFLLETMGRIMGLVSPPTLATYFLVLLAPIALLAIPAIKNRMGWPIQGAFVSLFLLVLFAGLNFVLANSIFGLAAGVFAWVSALFIWLLAAEDILEIGVSADTSETSSGVAETS